MKNKIITDLQILRITVGFIIEKKSWWHSIFYKQSSKDFMSYAFPKSKKIQSNAALDALRFSIDKEVGSNYYHLFRFPISVEEMIYKNSYPSISNLFDSENSALELLSIMSNGLIIDYRPGPKNIGSIDQLDDDIIQVFSAEYLNAFKNNYKVHPYLN